MAIDTNDDNNGQASSAMGAALASAREDQANKQQQQQQASSGDAAFSFRSIGRMARTAMARTPASENLNKFTKAMSELLAGTPQTEFEIALIPIDMQQTATLDVSSIVVAARDKQNPKLGVAYYTFIIEASVDVPQARFEMIQGANVEITRTIGEAYNNQMISTINDAVRRQFPQSRLLSAGMMVIPRSFPVEDNDQLYSLTANGVFACTQKLETSSPNFRDMNLANASRDSTLQVKATFDNPQIVDASSLPVRADVQIDFTAGPTNQQQQGFDRSASIAHVAGFFDLLWCPMQPQQQYGYQPNYNQPPNTQRYVARFVVSAMESHDLLTLPAQLLALASAFSIRENNAWFRAFRPKPFVNGELDIHDVGALSIESNLEGNGAPGYGPKFDVKSDSFREEDLGYLLSRTIHPEILLSLDVPESGASTWYNGVFAAAAEGDPAATNAILDAAQVLTNGNFGRHFPNGGRVCVDENNRIHLGYYTRNGVRHDLRDIDYLTILNLFGEKDPAIVRQWSDSFVNTSRPIQLRMADRLRIIKGIDPNAVVEDIGRRVTFEKEFTDAFIAGLVDVGLTTRTILPYTDTTYERASGNSFVAGALMSNTTAPIFNRGGNYGNQASGFTRQSVWGNRY